MSKIGICGGTFDPIHTGHLQYAEIAQKTLCLDEILFLPSGRPPHKLDRIVTPASKRLEMVMLAIRGVPFFSVSDLEIRRGGDTYTVDPLRELVKSYPQETVFYYLVGADALSSLFQWRSYKEVFRLCEFITVCRAGFAPDRFQRELREVSEAGAVVHVIEEKLPEISSSEIRRRRAAGESIRTLVPEAVEEYIYKYNLYENSGLLLHLEDRVEDLKELLSEKRFLHSMRVMDEAGRLAVLFGADESKCREAGLLHDCAKNLSPEQYGWLGADILPEGYGPYDGYHPELYHCAASTILAKHRYGVTDPEILDAIRYHAAGRPEMSLTEAIVFLADYTEPGRKGDSFQKIRDSLQEGLYPALLEACESTLHWILNKGETLDIATVRTRNYILNKMK